MAGERNIIVDQSREIAQNIHLLFTPAAQRVVLFRADRDLVIDEINLSYGVNAGGARTGHIAYATSATLTSNTDITVTDGIDFNGTANTNITPSFNNGSEAVAAGAVKGPGNNIVPEGAYVILELNGAVGTIAALAMSFRVRSHKA